MSRLNCKTGDFVMVVRSEWGNEGFITQCTEYLGDRTILLNGNSKHFQRDCWRTKDMLPYGHPHTGPTDMVPDEWLRPIPADWPDWMLEKVSKWLAND